MRHRKNIKRPVREKMKASERAFDSKEAFELVADHAQKHGQFAANHCTRWRTRTSHKVVPVPALRQFPSGHQRLVGFCEKIHKVVVRDLWRKVRLEATEQARGCTEQAKGFKAHGVPQGLCANLVNALKLLANQQKDGDGLLQNVVKGSE